MTDEIKNNITIKIDGDVVIIDPPQDSEKTKRIIALIDQHRLLNSRSELIKDLEPIRSLEDRQKEMMEGLGLDIEKHLRKLSNTIYDPKPKINKTKKRKKLHNYR